MAKEKRREGRIAPEGGYDFGNKRQYHRDLYPFFRDNCIGGPTNAHVLLMPSSEGTEIEVAERAGFRREHLHVVDNNPAIVAHLSRRYPGINTYGVDVGLAAQRIARRGIEVSVANLDLTGKLSDRTWLTLSAVGESGILKHGSLFAITLLRGRECGKWNVSSADVGHLRPEWLRAVRGSPTSLDVSRQAWAESAVAQRWGKMAIPLRSGIYRSAAGSQTMLWTISRMFEPFKQQPVDQVVLQYVRSIRPNHATAPDEVVANRMVNIWRDILADLSVTDSAARFRVVGPRR